MPNGYLTTTGHILSVIGCLNLLSAWKTTPVMTHGRRQGTTIGPINQGTPQVTQITTLIRNDIKINMVKKIKRVRQIHERFIFLLTSQSR